MSNQTAAAIAAITTGVNWERSGLNLQAIIEAGNQGKLGKPLTDWLVAEEWNTNRMLIVDHTKGFKALIAECGNSWVNDDITEKRFPITENDSGEWEYDLWDPCRSVSSESAVERMKGDNMDNPWMPGRFGHLLAFGTKNPDAQRKNPIIVLGSVAEVGGDRYVPYLYRDDSGRSLDLYYWVGAWDAFYRFLRVRKVKKS